MFRTSEFLTIVGLILCMIGIIFVYDARLLSRNERLIKIKDDQNVIAKRIKILGFVLLVIGALLFYKFFILV